MSNIEIVDSFGCGLAYLSLSALTLHLLLAASSKLGEAFTKTPLLDFWIAVFIWLPPLASLFLRSWRYALGVILAQIVFLLLYSSIHSSYYRLFKKQCPGRLMKTLGASIGRPRVFLGFLSTLLAIPVFLVIRAGQVFAYPLMIYFLRFPRYRHSDWIQLSRHKFDGLIGMDLLWCLYCEWAAGVYALGGEMVRNNESFWCPIRFYDSKHCENCQIDFPDLKEWIPQDKKMEDVENLLKSKYTKERKIFSWYKHPSRKGN